MRHLTHAVALVALALLPMQAHAGLFDFLVTAAAVVALGPAGLAITGITWGTVALTIGLAAYGQYQADQQRRQLEEQQKRARDAYNASLTDRTITSVSTEAPFMRVYGRARVGSAVVAILPSGPKDEYQHIIAIHAAHECDAIEEIYIAKKALGTLNADGFAVNSPDYSYQEERIQNDTGTSWTITDPDFVPASVQVFAGEWLQIPTPHTLTGNTVTVASSGDYRTRYMVKKSRVRVKKHLGVPGEAADATLIAEVGSKWTAASKLSGFCYTYIRLDLNQREFQGGLPAIEALVRGAKVYDPRTTTTAWSRNPALVLYDYLRCDFCGVPSSEIPVADVITAANVCDETISIGARYTFNGTVTSEQDQRTVIGQMAQAMAGGVDSTTWSMWAGKYVAPTLTLEQEDIVGALAITPGLSDADICNGVTARFISAENDYAATDMQPYQNATYLAADGRALFHSMEFPFTDETQRCHNLARIYVEDQRNSFTVKGVFSLKAWDTTIGQRVALNSSFFGWSAKVFRIVGKTYNYNSTVELLLKEDAPEIWDLADAVMVDATPNTGLPNPYQISAPASLTLASGDAELLLQADGTVVTRVLATWPASTNIYAAQAEIQAKPYASTDWKTVALEAADAGQAYLTDLKDGITYDARIRFVNPYLAVQSVWTLAAPHLVVGKTAAPANVGSVTYSIETLGIRLLAAVVADKDLAGYEFRVGGTGWDDAAFLVFQSSREYLWKIQTAANQVVRVKAKDTSGNYSATAASVTVEVVGPGAPVVSYQLAGPDEIISWTVPTTGFQVDFYEVAYGTNWGSATLVTTTKGTSLRRRVDYAGNRRWLVRAVDIAGNAGSVGQADAGITAPGSVTSARADVIDNNVLLYWGPPSTGSLPVDYYEVRKGATWAGGTPIGSNGNSTFTMVFEQESGTYTYWIAAVNSAGTAGTPVSVSAFVNQPPDYILRANIDSTFSGTKSNMLLEGSRLLAPVDTARTWTQHYSGAGYSTPQDKINAGFPIFVNPSVTTASYTEDIDYGSTLPATTIVVTPNTTLISGSVAVSVQIKWKLNAGDPWTSGAAGASSVLATNFRYVQVIVTFTATAGANLIALNGLNIKLSAKLRSDSGTGTSSVGGVTVNFGYPFLYADTPRVQANGLDAFSKPYQPAVIYSSVPNPTSFSVRIFNSAGTEVSGVTFSWEAKGY